MKKLTINCLLVFILCVAGVIQAQNLNVSGIVTDQSNMPLLGASVAIKGTAKGAVTDFDGRYTIEANTTDVLVVSYVGFTTQEISINGNTTVNVSLKEDAAQLEEVVVVGYGTQNKSEITAAITQVEVGEVLDDRPIVNVLEAVQGVVPGMQITSGSGEPGNLGLNVNIRGFTSINGGTPLFLLDNVEVNIADVNPQDIESITVLKDVSASSIYGARAAFGVVLLTTKKGKKNQKPKFNYSLTTSFSYPEDIPEKASTYDFVHAMESWGLDTYWTGQDIATWADFLEEQRANPSAFPNNVAVDGNGLEYSLRNTDLWDKLFSDKAFSAIHNLSVSGGSENISYRVSGGYSDQGGTIITDNDRYKKYNFNANVDFNISKKLSATTNVLYNRSNRTTSISEFNRSVDYPSFAPIDGNHVFDDGTVIPYETAINNEYLLPAPLRVINVYRMFQNLKYDITPDLNIIGEYTFERSTTDRYGSNPMISTVQPMSFSVITRDPALSSYTRTNDYTKYNVVNLYANYKKTFGNGHNFKAMLGYNREETYREVVTSRKEGLVNTDLPSFSQATGTATISDAFLERSLQAYFGRVNYNFKNKYFLEANLRYDGSSVFPSDDKYALFTSYSAGWIVTRENFMQNVEPLSFLKLRASYGELGNQKVYANNAFNVYPSIEQYEGYSTGWINPSTGLLAYTVGIPNRLISPSFTWERVETTNFGIDTRFFEDALSVSFDIYTRNTLDMLTDGVELPAVLGTNEPLDNVADLQTKGWELEVNWSDKIGKDFSFSLGLALSDSKSEITKFSNEAGLIYKDDGTYQYYVGKQIGEIWGYVTDGYYTVDDFEEGTLDADFTNGTLKAGVVYLENGNNPNPGDVKFKDLNGDGVINSGNNTLYTELDSNGNPVTTAEGFIHTGPGDRQVIGNNRRRYQYGITGNFNYKDFDLSFVINGVGKRDVWQSSPFIFPYQGEFSTMFAHQLDYWTPENTDAFLPRNYERGTVNYSSNRRVQTKYLLDGSYVRLKNVSFGYSLPKSVLDKLKIDKLRIFVSAENLFNWDHLPDGVNTELTNQGSGATYPFARTFSTGVNFQF
ncbi:MAG: SusC/RagA family TonB-linked outer membrane protein [Aestuariibaculum sp.]